MAGNFVISEVDGGRAWTYAIHDDHGEPIAVAARSYQRRDECESAIVEVFNRYDFDLTVRQRKDGNWGWELSKAGRPLLVSPRIHTSLKSCAYAMRRIKRLIEDLARSGRPHVA